MNRIDIHVHSVLRRTDVAFGNPFMPESHYISDPAETKDTLLRQGIDHAILMSSGEGPCRGVHSLEGYNSVCLQISQNDPHFFSWMCGLDPEHIDTLKERMALCKEQGAVGVGEVMVGQWLDSPYYTRLFEAAEKLDLPVLCHMSPQPGFSYGAADLPGLPLLEKTLQKHPHLKYIGHSQVFWMEISGDCPKDNPEKRNSFGKGPVVKGGTLERLMSQYPNLYADLSAYSGSCAIMRDEAYGLSFLEHFKNRLLFGTDTLNRHTIFPLADFLDAHLKDGTLSQEAYEKIMYRNAKELFRLETNH